MDTRTPRKPAMAATKCAHVIALDNGNFAAWPNNRIQWFDPAFITPFHEKPDFSPILASGKSNANQKLPTLTSTTRLALHRAPRRLPSMLKGCAPTRARA